MVGTFWLLVKREEVNMKKFIYILKGIIGLVKKHKMYFLLPVFLMLAFVALLVGALGSKALIAFIYAGI